MADPSRPCIVAAFSNAINVGSLRLCFSSVGPVVEDEDVKEEELVEVVRDSLPSIVRID
jgi:hypothetical protein